MLLPNFLILGAAKAGTTALARFLGQHPQVDMPYKEPNYFSGWGTRVKFYEPPIHAFRRKKGRRFHSLEDYSRLYEGGAGKAVRLDASVSYLMDDRAAEHIQQVIPDAKMLVLLRQPVDRAFSHFTMFIREGWEPGRDFMEFVSREHERIRANWNPAYRYMEMSHYCGQLARYLSRFPSGQVRLRLYEDWNDHPQEFWDELIGFLGLDPGYRPDFSRRINVSYTPTVAYTLSSQVVRLCRRLGPGKLARSIDDRVNAAFMKVPRLDPAVRRELTHRYFLQDILQLQGILGRDLAHWLQ